jgi:hypothetical protein
MNLASAPGVTLLTPPDPRCTVPSAQALSSDPLTGLLTHHTLSVHEARVEAHARRMAQRPLVPSDAVLPRSVPLPPRSTRKSQQRADRHPGFALPRDQR